MKKIEQTQAVVQTRLFLKDIHTLIGLLARSIPIDKLDGWLVGSWQMQNLLVFEIPKFVSGPN